MKNLIFETRPSAALEDEVFQVGLRIAGLLADQEYDATRRRWLVAGSASHTHACCANHSCSVRQIGQYERAKNTGMELKRSGSASYPVAISRPVSGHRIMTVPILASCGGSVAVCCRYKPGMKAV